MTVFDVGGGVAEVVSLSARQVRRMLHSLELHRAMLQAGHEDATRFALHHHRPGYLLDFELIFRYAFLPDTRPDWASEMQYLFDCQDTTFLVGPGTQFEIEQFLHTTGYLISEDGTPEDLAPSGRSSKHSYGLNPETIKVGIFRLSQLLRLPNLLWYRDLAPNPTFDEDAFEKAKAALDYRRRGPRARGNRWDALNWVAVTYLRERSEALQIDFFPFLLTATKPLLEASSWTYDATTPVSRQPADAIYTEILFKSFPDPVEAANHTIEMAVRAASLNEGLRRTPAFLNPRDFENEPEWEKALEEELVADEFRVQLEELATFVSDPVVAETQRIYDNARLATASAEHQRGAVLRALEESPRKLFDLIIEVSAALKAGQGEGGLAELWTTLLEMSSETLPNRMSYQLYERNGDRESTQYLAAERYLVDGSTAKGEEQFVLRWPTSLNSEGVISSFSRAFTKHDVETVDLIVGTETGVQHLAATLPITLDDLLDALSAEEDGYEQQLYWVRMGARIFDLYADVAPKELTHEPVVGVFVNTLNPEHLEDLYVRTSARYLLPAWFRRALEAIQDRA